MEDPIVIETEQFVADIQPTQLLLNSTIYYFKTERFNSSCSTPLTLYMRFIII